MNRAQTKSSDRRRGTTVMEITIALVIVLALLAAVAQSVIAVAGQRRMFVRRQMAMQEGANLMERIISQPWDDVTDEKLAEWKFSGACERLLPAARLSISAQQTEQQPQAKRVAIEIRWTNAAGEQASPVRLVAWKYRTEDVE